MAGSLFPFYRLVAVLYALTLPLRSGTRGGEELTHDGDEFLHCDGVGEQQRHVPRPAASSCAAVTSSVRRKRSSRAALSSAELQNYSCSPSKIKLA